MNRKLLIASVLCFLGALGLVVVSSSREFPFYGAGLLLEVAFLVFVTWLVWLARLSAMGRIGLVLLSIVAMSALSTYLDSLVFGKIDFHPAFILQSLVGHLIITGLFLAGVFVVDRFIAAILFRRRRTG
jgi:hypothetical protein